MPPQSVSRLCDVLAVRAELVPERLAHDDTTTAVTFRVWDAEANEVAGGLAAAGVGHGDRVLLPITNRHATQFAIAYIAVQRAGAIPAPVNTRLTPVEVEYYRGLLGAEWAITDTPECLERVNVPSWSVDAMPRSLGDLPDQTAFSAEDDADILSTSGTTGRPKGVVGTHAEAVQGIGDLSRIDRSTSLLHALPVTGFGGCRGCMMLPLRLGTSVITQPAFDPAGFLALAEERRPTSLQLVPAMLRLIVNLPDAADYDLAGVRWVFTGTAPLPQDTIDRLEALWPHLKLINVYGQTEGAGGVSTRSAAALRKPGSVGRPAEAGGLEIRGEDGRPLPAGSIGAIWVRSAHPKRYWNDPDATARTWKDGWLDTGDLGYVDVDGDLILSGRSTEIIIRGGTNIAPAEIEDVLQSHPAVSEAAVVGVDHDVLGQDVAAAVVIRRGAAVSAEALRSWCAGRLADYKVPRVVVVADHLPRNANGKVLKSELGPVLQAAADARRR